MFVDGIFLQIDSSVTGRSGVDVSRVEVYRRESYKDDGEDINTTPKLITIQESGSFIYKDFTVVSGTAYQYMMRVFGVNGSVRDTSWLPK